MKQTPAHVIISWVFLIVIGIVFSYSYFFYPNAHPIACLIKSRTGHDCATCGFSRAFSLYTHFEFTLGKACNPLSWNVFLFFILQALIRLFVVLRYFFLRKDLAPAYLKADIIISISAFLLAFLPILFKSL